MEYSSKKLGQQIIQGHCFRLVTALFRCYLLMMVVFLFVMKVSLGRGEVLGNS